MNTKIIIVAVAVAGIVLAYYLTRQSAVGAASMTTPFSGQTPSPYPGGARTVPYTYGSSPSGPLAAIASLFSSKPVGNVGFTNQGPMPPPSGVQAPSSMPVAGSSDVLASQGSAVAGDSIVSPIDLGTGVDTQINSWDSGIINYGAGFSNPDISSASVAV
jgi:hypothetical protein